MNITVYSNKCPNCKLLEEFLDKKHVEYDLVSDVQEMINKGFDHVPMVEIDGTVYEMDAAMLKIGEMINEE